MEKLFIVASNIDLTVILKAESEEMAERMYKLIYHMENGDNFEYGAKAYPADEYIGDGALEVKSIY